MVWPLRPARAYERILELWLELFNTATLPFYWARFETERGRPDTRRLLAAARWFTDRGCAVKGHPLCWHTLAPDWLLDLSDREVEAALRARITREVTDARRADRHLGRDQRSGDHAGLRQAGERHHPPVPGSSGGSETVRLAFETARQANPGATLLLNDFDMSSDYEHLVEDCLAGGIAIDALGLQSHMHQGYWGEEKTLDVLERFARFGLPLHFTESTLVSGQLMPPEIVDLNDYQVADWPSTPEGEARQADEVVAHYTTLLADPAVQAVTWWGLPDGGWLNAPSGLIRADGTPKPAFEALRGLVKESWWLGPTRFITDEGGRLDFTGFLGEYACSAGGAPVTITLDQPGSCGIEARLEA